MIMKNQLRDLTRKIVLGATIGGAPLLTVGCAAPTPELQPVVAAPRLSEKQEVKQIMASRDPQAVEAFLTAYPTSHYSISLLNALPPSVLVQVSRQAIAGLPPQTLRHLTRRTRAALARSVNEGGAGAPEPQPAGSPSVFLNGGNSGTGTSSSRGGY